MPNPYDHPSLKRLWHARVKLQRAQKLINEAKEEYERFASSGPIEIISATAERVYVEGEGPDQATYGLNFSKRDLDTPYLATAIVGDAIHNIRASLDIMACEFVRERGGDDKGVYFPFAHSADQLDKQIKAKKFDRAGPEAIELLKQFSPYKGGNEALRALHDADNEDKHSRLVSLQYGIKLAAIRIEEIDEVPTPVFRDQSTREIIGDLLFPDDSAFSAMPVFPTLEDLVQLASGIVEAFASLLDVLAPKA